MRTLRVKGQEGHFVVEVEDVDALQRDTYVIEYQGRPIALVTPLAQTTVQDGGRSSLERRLYDQQREIQAFQRMRTVLEERYAGRVVAIYQGRVVAVGDDRQSVLREVWERFGPVTCYIERVGEAGLRKVRIPAAWRREH